MEPAQIEERVLKIIQSAYELGIGLPVIELHPYEYHMLLRHFLENNPYIPMRETSRSFKYHCYFGEYTIEPSRDVPRGIGHMSLTELEDTRKADARNHRIYQVLKARKDNGIRSQDISS